MDTNVFEKKLYEFTPAELKLKELYELGRLPLEESEYRSVILPFLKNLSQESCSFEKMSAPGNPRKLLEFTEMPSTLEDTIWLLHTDDMILRKHLRYSPANRHSHNFIELSYVLSGQCTQTFYLPSGIEETLCLTEGCLCILPPGMEHKVEVLDSSLIVNILIRTSAMKHKMNRLIEGNGTLFQFFLHTLYDNKTPNYLLFHTKSCPQIRRLILEMLKETYASPDYLQKTLLLMLGLLFTYLQNECSEEIRFSKNSSLGITYIPQILNYIRQNFTDTSVEELASRFSLSTSYLSRIFKEHTQMTLTEALQQIRVQKACEYLCSTSLSVQSIAEAVGYDDVTHFIRVFKKLKQMTPLQYRKQH